MSKCPETMRDVPQIPLDARSPGGGGAAVAGQASGKPGAPFDGLEVLSPACAFPNRHASILLAWDAVLGAIEDVAGNDEA